jgi:hypothetical protein
MGENIGLKSGLGGSDGRGEFLEIRAKSVTESIGNVGMDQPGTIMPLDRAVEKKLPEPGVAAQGLPGAQPGSSWNIILRRKANRAQRQEVGEVP